MRGWMLAGSPGGRQRAAKTRQNLLMGEMSGGVVWNLHSLGVSSAIRKKPRSTQHVRLRLVCFPAIYFRCSALRWYVNER